MGTQQPHANPRVLSSHYYVTTSVLNLHGQDHVHLFIVISITHLFTSGCDAIVLIKSVHRLFNTCQNTQNHFCGRCCNSRCVRVHMMTNSHQHLLLRPVKTRQPNTTKTCVLCQVSVYFTTMRSKWVSSSRHSNMTDRQTVWTRLTASRRDLFSPSQQLNFLPWIHTIDHEAFLLPQRKCCSWIYIDSLLHRHCLCEGVSQSMC